MATNDINSSLKRPSYFLHITKLAPSSYSENKENFRDHLSSLLKKFEDLCDQLNEEERPINWDLVKGYAKYASTGINEAVKRIYLGQHSSAYNYLRTRLDKMPNFYGTFAAFKDSTYFFRMRHIEKGSLENPIANDLFHIPFSKRSIASTERFSAPGYPCLYLGTSSYICWEEMGKQNINECYVSKFKTNKEIVLFNLSLPEVSEWQNEDYFLGYITRYPFIIASMIKVYGKKNPFKPEYIIPQLIMEWIIEQILNTKRSEKLVGIYYTSVLLGNNFNFPDSVYNNLALPSQSPLVGTHSKELCDLFDVSKPISDETLRVKGWYNDSNHIYIRDVLKIN